MEIFILTILAIVAFFGIRSYKSKKQPKWSAYPLPAEKVVKITKPEEKPVHKGEPPFANQPKPVYPKPEPKVDPKKVEKRRKRREEREKPEQPKKPDMPFRPKGW